MTKKFHRVTKLCHWATPITTANKSYNVKICSDVVIHIQCLYHGSFISTTKHMILVSPSKHFIFIFNITDKDQLGTSNFLHIHFSWRRSKQLQSSIQKWITYLIFLYIMTQYKMKSQGKLATTKYLKVNGQFTSHFITFNQTCVSLHSTKFITIPKIKKNKKNYQQGLLSNTQPHYRHINSSP